jgi:hypothetical protein
MTKGGNDMAQQLPTNDRLIRIGIKTTKLEDGTYHADDNNYYRAMDHKLENPVQFVPVDADATDEENHKAAAQEYVNQRFSIPAQIIDSPCRGTTETQMHWGWELNLRAIPTR